MGRSGNNEFARRDRTRLDSLQNESYLQAMIAALHGLIAPANITKGYVDHEFVIGSLNDPSARSTCLERSPMCARPGRRHNWSPCMECRHNPNLRTRARAHEIGKRHTREEKQI